eukprot:m.66404 g.66404  ORF g.66404 m.66404 type:complete len:51 (-) comp14050_c0_seq1:143-295(-)
MRIGGRANQTVAQQGRSWELTAGKPPEACGNPLKGKRHDNARTSTAPEAA